MEIGSDNPSFSYVISKNPSSPFLIKKLRKGFLLSGFTYEANKYVSTFVEEEGPTSSFSENSYLSSSHSALLYINIISTLFKSCIKQKHELDVDGYQNHVSVPFMPMKEKDLLFIKKSFDDKGFDISLDNWNGTSKYRLSISSKKSLYSILNLLHSLLFVSLLDNEEYINFEANGFLDKYIDTCLVNGLPYLFISRIKNGYLIKANIFAKYKDKFETCFNTFENETISLEKGNNLEIRKRWIESKIDTSLPLVDVGCGTGNYLYLAKKVPLYIPIDQDPNCRTKITLKTANKGIKNSEVPYESIKEFLATMWLRNNKRVQYLMTEVLEHMDIDEAINLVRTCLANGGEKIIITFPNKEFNKYYPNVYDGFRHPDHKWEGTVSMVNQIVTAVKKTDPDSNFSVGQIGDTITGLSGTTTQPTIFLLIKKNK